MQLERPQVIVRSVAVLTAVIACCGLIVIAYFARLAALGYSGFRYRHLAACGLFTVVPFMFVWASIQAWRFAPKGIVSIYSGYLLFGFMGFAASVLHWSWSKETQDVVNGMISVAVFAIGVLVALQERRFRKEVG